MPAKSIDDLRISMGLAPLSRKREATGYVLLHLAFRLKELDARMLLLECEKLEISESIFARQAILEKLKKENHDAVR